MVMNNLEIVRPATSLAILPTPLVPAPRLTHLLGGLNLWIKRDDLTGFAFGGNKVRCLEFFLEDALRQKADTIVTGGGPQSNHVRATAAAAARASLHMTAIYHGSPAATINGNERLTRLLGAQVRFTHNPDRASVELEIEQVVMDLQKNGFHPYAIPRGGSSPLGALGYVWAARELAEQCEKQGLKPDAIVLATGSCGTHAGLLAGVRSLHLPWRIEGFSVSRPVSEAKGKVQILAQAVLDRMHQSLVIEPEDVIIHDNVIGEGYGIPTQEAGEAIQLMARAEGIFLDPTYTGKAFAGFMALGKSGHFHPNETVIFLHTGGEPALFAGDGTWLLESVLDNSSLASLSNHFSPFAMQ